MKTSFFSTTAEFRKWMEGNHEKEVELWVGFYKINSGKLSITWSESVDVALCFGWIDGIRKSIDELSYKIRFTRRKKGSTWSNINIRKMGELMERGLMRPSGLKAFDMRQDKKSGIYSYERKEDARLAPVYEKKFKANRKAWSFFQSQPAWYRRTSIHWIMSAKKEETRIKRLTKLIKDSQNGVGAPKRL